MTIVVTGTAISTRTQRVLLVLEEIGLQYELRAVDLRNREHKTTDFRMKYNPFGKVPVLQHGDTKLFESRAICRYLAAKYKSPLIPANVEALGFFEQMDSVGYGFFDAAIDYVADEMIFRRNSVEGEIDQRRVDINKRTIAECLDYYDSILGENEYLAGNDLSLVDLFHAPIVNFMATRLELDHEITSRPNVRAWRERVMSRASWKAVMARAKSS